MVEPAPGRQQPQHLLGGVGQPLDAHHERVAQGGGQAAAPVEAGRQELLGEERVALAALEQTADEVRRGLWSGREERSRKPGSPRVR